VAVIYVRVNWNRGPAASTAQLPSDFGDNVIGTNQTLPTGKAARHTGGLWVCRRHEDLHLSEGANRL